MSLCAVTTLAGEPCHQRPISGLACCWNHVPHWCGMIAHDHKPVHPLPESFANLLAFALAVPVEVMSVGMHSGLCLIWLTLATEPGHVAGLYRHRATFRMSRECAAVFADAIGSMGNAAGCAAIIKALG